MRKLPVHYICPKINKAECENDEQAYIAKLAQVISDELQKHYEYFNSFDLIVNYYDFGQAELTKIIKNVFTNLFSNVEFRKVQPAEYKLFQVADLICTIRNHLLRSLAQAEKRDNLITISEDDLSGYRVTSASRASPQRGLFSDDKIMVKACRGHYED